MDHVLWPTVSDLPAAGTPGAFPLLKRASVSTRRALVEVLLFTTVSCQPVSCYFTGVLVY
jgi:hypothetical protein